MPRPILIAGIIFLLVCKMTKESCAQEGNISYGVNFSSKYAQNDLNLNWRETYLKILDDLEVKKLRLMAYWDEIEKEEGVYDFSDLDFQITEAQKRGVEVILVLGRKVPRWPECHDPAFLSSKTSEDVKDQLLNLLTEEVNHFKSFSNITTYQVENEPFFPFGKCSRLIANPIFVKKEIDLVKKLDPSRSVLIQDSGEIGIWPITARLGDILGISLYRHVVFTLPILNKGFYVTYPFSPSWYLAKAKFFRINPNDIIITELQGEPWGTKPALQMSPEEINKTMSPDKFVEIVKYAQDSKITTQYFWGVEWWYREYLNGNPFYWITAKQLFKTSSL